MSGYYASRKAARRRVVPLDGLVEERPTLPWWLLGMPFLLAAMLGSVIGIFLAHGALP